MKKVTIIVIVALLIIVTGTFIKKSHIQPKTIASTGIPNAKTVPLQPVTKGGVGQNGMAVLTETKGKVNVAISLTGGKKLNNPQPVNIHFGACDAHGARAYTLHDIVNGNSVTIINATLAKLHNQYPLYIDTHKSDTQRTIDTMCGNLP
jgi:hypothetical protein